MARWPEDVAFTVITKRAGQQRWQAEGEFVVDSLNTLGGGEYPEGQARLDADALAESLYANHTGGEKEYVVLRCQVWGWEIRPV